MSGKFFVTKHWPVSRDEPDLRMHEYVGKSRLGETRENFATRILQEMHPAQAAIDRPVAPIIAPLLNAPWPKYDPATVDAAAKLESGVIFSTRWLNCIAAEALDGILAPDSLVMATGSVAGVPVVDTFKALAPRLENFQSICINEVVGPRFRVAANRSTMLTSFAGIPLVAQMARALYLGKILPLQLAIFNPAKMAIEFWFSAKGTAANAKFARTAFKLGYVSDNPFNPALMAAMPCAEIPHPPPAASLSMLKSVGIERRDGRQNLVLFKRTNQETNN